MMADLLRLAWLAAIALALLRLFGSGRRGVERDAAAPIAHLCRAVIVAVLAVNVLSRLHIFNAATLLLVCAAWPIGRWLKHYDWHPEAAIRAASRRIVLEAVSRSERPLSAVDLARARAALIDRASTVWRLALERTERMTTAEVVKTAVATAAVAMAAYLRFAHVIGETRLSHPQLYETLLATRQALFNSPSRVVGVNGALAAALSTLASMDALHVVRLLWPVCSFALVIASARLVLRCTRSESAALLTLALLAPWPSGGADICCLFLVFAAHAARTRTPASPHGVVAALAAAWLALPRAPLPAILVAAAPAFCAIAAGFACAWAARFARRVTRLRLDVAAAPALGVMLAVLLPQRPHAMFLEHPIAGEKALEIASTQPRGRWMIVAPVEQLAEAYGRGWYEEPASFVERYGARAADPAFRFDYSVDEILVFVEKQPFKTFAAEPANVPFETLTDPTYRNYRSNAGRASLQARLQALCQAYQRAHDGVSMYYEDHDLAIYRFRVRG